MTSIDELVLSDSVSSNIDAPDTDPLTGEDALQEAQLLDSRVCQLSSTAALLFELRTSLQFDVGNSALLVLRGLRSFVWSSPAVRMPLVALTVASSAPNRRNGLFRLEVDFFPEARLHVEGDLAEFYVLEVEGIGDVPPDYSSSFLEGVQGRLPNWSSPCSLLQASNSR
ncbi:hypothetical protein [Micromonospora sp. bgisy143]|uniref:hypothetical protein n=1 Tax=Micromonospora sp. bgisy143 TaxID=3413790 RepID=UPI003EC14C6C